MERNQKKQTIIDEGQSLKGNISLKDKAAKHILKTNMRKESTIKYISHQNHKVYPKDKETSQL